MGVGCLGDGWSPYWLPPLSHSATLDALLLFPGEILCPYCAVMRAQDANAIPGLNTPKRLRIFAVLDGFHCMKGGGRSVGHVHLLDFPNESLLACRAQPPGLAERGY